MENTDREIEEKILKKKTPVDQSILFLQLQNGIQVRDFYLVS